MTYKKFNLIQFSKLLKNKEYYQIEKKSFIKLEKYFDYWIQLNDKWYNIKYIYLNFDYPEYFKLHDLKTYEIEQSKKILNLFISHPSYGFTLKTTYIIICKKKLLNKINQTNLNEFLTRLYYKLW